MLKLLQRLALAVTPAALMFLLLATPFAHADDDFLDPELAFKFSAKMVDAKTAEVTYVIADGYYMYREHFKFRVEDAKLGTPIYPKGKIHYDQTFEKNVETYVHSVTVKLPVDAKGAFTLIATGQGCAEKGLCYPPQESRITLTPPAGAAPKATSDVQAPPSHGGGDAVSQPPVAPATTTTSPATTTAAVSTPAAAETTPAADPAAAPAQAASATSSVASPATAANAVDATDAQAAQAAAPIDAESGVFASALKGRNLLVILPLFFLAGLGLALTPCVLPMVPILSGIIIGEGAGITRARSFILSLTYSLGMAIFYTAIGVSAGLAGAGLTASFQNPVVLTGFALLIAVLSLSMFDVYQLQMPAFIQEKMVSASGKQSSGKLAGVFVMGALSGLIVGPCVAAPLIGALVVIGQTRDAVLGGGALFVLAMGMSMPLLLVGLSAGWLLPRLGNWMEAIKYFFGVVLLGVALWLVSPVIAPRVQMIGWAILGLAYGAYMLLSKRWGNRAKFVGVVFALFGVVQLTGAATGASDVFEPLAKLTNKEQEKTNFMRVKSVAELDAALAKNPKATAMLDFYADWCVSCKEMEKFTFTDPAVKQKFSNMILLQADVTANNDDDKALLKRFNLYGPPGIIFFDKAGHEINGGRVVGYQKPEKFSASLDNALQHAS